MLKFMYLKAEGGTSTNASEAKQQDSLDAELPWIRKMDKMINENLWSEKKTTDHDVPAHTAKQEELDKYYSDRSETTWRERLNVMWSVDAYGMFSPEVQFVKQATELSFFAGLCYGAYHESAKVQRIFLEQNKYTMFQHPREAQRAMQERIVLGMVQGGWRSGWRMGVLSFTFTSVCQSLVVMRNYINPLDYAMGGAVMGAVYKVNMGPKGMLGAGVAGSLLGFQAGILTWGLQKFSGETVAEKWEREYSVIREANDLKKGKTVKKDPRLEIIIEEENRVKPGTWVQNEENKEDWFRNMTVKITVLMERMGFLKTHSEDSFRISDDSQEQGVVKSRLHQLDIGNPSELRTQPETNDPSPSL